MKLLRDTFGIGTSNSIPNHDDIIRFKLDHFFGLEVKLNKKRTKGKIVSLYLDPESYNIEPPYNFTGLWKIYSVDGRLDSERSYINGVLDGFESIYRQDGSVCWSKLYIKGEIQYQRGYSTFGELTSERIFDDKEREKYKNEFIYESTFQNK